MAKLAIKNENVTPFGGIYHIMDVFSKLGLGELIESVFFFSQREHGVHARHGHAEKFLSVSDSGHHRKGKAAEEDKQAKSLHTAFHQLPDQMDTHRQTVCTKPLYAQSLFLSQEKCCGIKASYKVFLVF